MGNLRMPRMANIVISGRMTSDPKMTTLPTGTTKARFRIANDQRRGGKQETLFMSAVAWGKTAEFIDANTHKGTPVLLSGSLEYSTWTKRDGTQADELCINVDNVQLLEWDDDHDAGSDDQTTYDDEHLDEDIPF